MIAHVLSIGGGKEPTALALLAQVLETPNLQPVFPDHGPTVRATDPIKPHGIRMVVWSSTGRGGRQFDLQATDGQGCSSAFGLCEGRQR